MCLPPLLPDSSQLESVYARVCVEAGGGGGMTGMLENCGFLVPYLMSLVSNLPPTRSHKQAVCI